MKTITLRKVLKVHNYRQIIAAMQQRGETFELAQLPTKLLLIKPTQICAN